jgi:hypothetical protein
MESALPSLTSNASASEFSSNLGATVSDFVAGLHRINARRAANRAAASSAAAAASAKGIDAPADRYDSSVPNLSAEFDYLAWRS